METLKFQRSSFLGILEMGGVCVVDEKTNIMGRTVRITVKDAKFKIESVGGISSIRSFGDCLYADSDTMFCVNYRELYSYVKAISSDEFTLIHDKQTVTIEHEDGKTTLACFPGSDFPEAEKPDPSLAKYSIDGALLRKWISSAKNFADNNDSKPQLNGINIVADNGILCFGASDTKALVYEEVEYDKDAKFNFIIDAKSFPVILSAVHDCDNVAMMVSNTSVFLSTPVTKVSIRRTVGAFPKVSTILPKSSPFVVRVNKAKLLAALKRIKASTNHSLSIVKLFFTEDMMSLEFEDILNNRSGKEQLMYESDSIPDVSIAFLLNLFDKCVSVLNCDTVCIGLTAYNKAAVFYAPEDEEENIKTLSVPTLNATRAAQPANQSK